MKKNAPEGLLLREIGAAMGTSKRALRQWIKHGLLEPAPFRGAGTRYGPEFVARAQEVRRLRDQGLLFVDIRQRMAVESAATAATPPPQPPEATPPAAADTWERIVLLPGLELHLRTTGGPLLRRLATEISAQYRAS